MKKILLVLVVALFISCGAEDNREELLSVYTAQWGRPTTIVEENMGKVLFVTYTWDSSRGHAKLVLSKAKNKSEEVRFTSY